MFGAYPNKTALASTADNMLSKLDKQDTKEGNCQTLPRQAFSKENSFAETSGPTRNPHWRASRNKALRNTKKNLFSQNVHFQGL
ncbi:hypothetical protein ACRRTK_020659 [Alexandromys fortis]